ncbi:peptidase S10 [Pelagerythrobacter marensis]|uniref:Peptidase S10 n=1 Tax=Pelagerythrobacter marensis TaxID=543877 RepID=A0ABZ2D7J6_9SPHN
MKTGRNLILTLAAASLALGASPSAAQEFDRPMPPSFLKAMEPMVPRERASDRTVTTRHRGSFNGKAVAYDAIVTETPVANAAGETAAVVVTYAYVARNAGDASDRPVLFIFNGGPGASSSPLHMHAFGPRVIGSDGSGLVNNEYSPLDVADLVFVDPPGTGASMPVAGADPSSLFSVAGDAGAVAEVVEAWREANGRTASPYALVGESYGSARALAMLGAQMEAGLPLPDGVGLLSMSIGDTSGPVIADVVLLPTLAAVAWYHGAVAREGRTARDVYDAALRFAQDEYATALIRGPSLPDGERRALAARLSALIGLPAEVLLENDLRLDKQGFMLGLLADRGLRTGQLDARATRSIAESNFQPPFDDPSMTLGTSTSETIEAYLAGELGYPLPSPYRSLNLGINFKWGWGEGTSYRTARFTPHLAKAMAQKPGMTVFTVGGLYDITTPAYAGIFALDQAGIPLDRRSTHLYPAGHSVFEDPEGLAALSADIRRWAGELRRTKR